ncbi:MAG: epoxyqueuosine reductase [Solirubrobacterales bacterium]
MRQGNGLLKERIKAGALALGADLVGFAPVERMAGAPEGFRPHDLMPNARTVIALALRIPEAAVRLRHKTTYSRVNGNAMDRLDDLAFRLAGLIEDLGGLAYPVPADEPYLSWNAERRHGQGDLSHRHAAAAAGLGVLGKNHLLMTPKFGNRVNLVTVLTDLAIEPDPVIERSLCPDECELCLKVCPAAAIGPESTMPIRCRERINCILPRGFEVYGCWECRRVCPGGRSTAE